VAPSIFFLRVRGLILSPFLPFPSPLFTLSWQKKGGQVDGQELVGLLFFFFFSAP